MLQTQKYDQLIAIYPPPRQGHLKTMFAHLFDFILDDVCVLYHVAFAISFCVDVNSHFFQLITFAPIECFFSSTKRKVTRYVEVTSKTS